MTPSFHFRTKMLVEIRNAVLLSRLRDEEAWLTARDALEMATIGGAQVLGRDDIGQLVPGMRADIGIYSLTGIEYAGAWSDPLAALVFTVRHKPVDTLIIDGHIRIRNGQTEANEEQLFAEHKRISFDMLERAEKHTGIDFGIRNRNPGAQLDTHSK